MLDHENPYVTLRHIAGQMGLDVSNARKYVLKSGFTFVRLRTPDSGNQLVLALTLEDAEAVLDFRRKQGYGPVSKPINNEVGSFYVVQLVPELDPRRVKLGFASDANARLQAHRTSAPTAMLVKTWQCRRTWEETAIASLTREASQLIANEVYEVSDIPALITRGDAFFALMPST